MSHNTSLETLLKPHLIILHTTSETWSKKNKEDQVSSEIQ